jgi:pyruvate dehydrogenase E2 component (dihydrolipoamide acetyltransferase)
MATEFVVPELGENVEKADVGRVLVKIGDVIVKDQPVVELETDKATVEVPSSVAGKITEIKIKAGEKVKVGQVVLVVDATSNGAAAGAASAAAEPGAAAGGKPAGAAPPEAEAKPAPKPAPVVDISTARATLADAPAARAAEPASVIPARDGIAVPAAPSVRRFARELGVDIAEVAGTGPGGRIGQDDVKTHVKTRMQTGGGASGAAYRAPALPDFSKWGAVDIKPMSNIRRKTAEHLSDAWQAPHVTQHDKADVTALEEFRKLYGARVEKAGGKLTVTAITIKVLAAAIQKYPQFASSVDMAKQSLVFKKYTHIGVAVDTPNGLLVPVLRDVDRKTITEIAADLAALSQKARDKKLGLDDMSGGVMSVTNLGGIGGTSFTPIVNVPEVAILGMSRAAIEPVWRDNAFVPRQMLPLSLSYDHRVIDGADAARFLRFVVDGLEQPLSMVL